MGVVEFRQKKKGLGYLFFFSQDSWLFIFPETDILGGGEDLARARLFCLLFSSALLSLFFFLCSCDDGGMVDEGLQDILDRRSVVMCNTHKCLVVELLGLLLLSEVYVCVCVSLRGITSSRHGWIMKWAWSSVLNLFFFGTHVRVRGSGAYVHLSSRLRIGVKVYMCLRMCVRN